MTLKEVKAIAKKKNLTVANTKKAEIIRAIQRDECNNDCFATGTANECGQMNCLWRPDCLQTE
jgi:hypothetical protein